MGKKEFFKGALLGALIGSVAALLTTTKTGAQRKEEIKKMATELFGGILKDIEQTQALSKAKYEEVVEKAVQKYGAKKQELSQKTLGEVATELKSKWTEVKKHLG